MRPANLLTAAADVLAVAALAFGETHSAAPTAFPTNLWLLLLSTVGLYGGGVVLNDVFDAQLDAVERPERPIPSGRVSLGQASALGIALLVVGVGAAYLYRPYSGWLALIIAGLAVFYDRFGKHHAFFGPLNMGLCRGVNLLLGLSAAGTLAVTVLWPVGLVPVVYIAAVTMVSRGEVHGGSRSTLYGAANGHPKSHRSQHRQGRKSGGAVAHRDGRRLGRAVGSLAAGAGHPGAAAAFHSSGEVFCSHVR